MRIQTRCHRFATTALALLCLSAVGCGSSLSGTYEDPNGMPVTKVEFKSGGKAYMTMGMFGVGQTTEVSYRRDGDKVILEMGAGANIVLTVQKDGSLSNGGGMMSVNLKKAK